jgi:hypothetical protein
MAYGGHHIGSNFFTAYIDLGISLKAKNGGKVDAAFVPFTNQENWENTPYAKYNTTAYMNVKLGNNDHIILGRPVMRIGQKTGVTYGKIAMKAVFCLYSYANL